jgi:ferric-dicitrate binding protein FerR (iron transport regulator)
VALEGGGTLRIAHGSVVEAHNVNEIELREGLIYVDLPPGLNRPAAFVVRTSLGSIEHVGTQFEVATVDHTVRIRVREGKVRLRREKEWEVASAGTEMIVPQSGPVIRQALLTHGNQWSWVEALAPDYEIEDEQLVDFLQWAARETGRELDIADGHAREVAEQTRLHGTVDGLDPLEAVGRVISTTTLRYDLHEGAIRVSSGR